MEIGTVGIEVFIEGNTNTRFILARKKNECAASILQVVQHDDRPLRGCLFYNMRKDTLRDWSAHRICPGDRSGESPTQRPDSMDSSRSSDLPLC